MRRSCLAFALLAATPCFAHAQWEMQDPHITADLRGIDYIGNGVAWASGTNGTILRTEDMGFVWQLCVIPPGAKKLDFRGIQAFSNNTAVVMSSGKGELSRLFKTTDGCQTWKEVFVDPDETGFFDSLHRATAKQLFVLGDPVNGKFTMFTSRDAGDTWFIEDDPGLEAPAGAGAFAASNSSLINIGPYLTFGTGGPQAAVYRIEPNCDAKTGSCSMAWKAAETPIAHGRAEDGVYSVAGRFVTSMSGKSSSILVAVGGAYDKPAETNATAAYSQDGGITWTAAQTPPGGYRSAVAYDPATATWVTVGPNGTDLSKNDGKTWTPLPPGAASAAGTLENSSPWNSLSLPFVVGPKGRIAILTPFEHKSSAAQKAKQ
ncbi:MAG: WD40/YVTN/BNR-like repeat-containing protein [Janthinobacterium lividum]